MPQRRALIIGGSLGGLFAGRDEDLADLHTALLGAKGAPIALTGLGGIGKTRLAIEYAWRHRSEYSALLFVRAEDNTLEKLARALKAHYDDLVHAPLPDKLLDLLARLEKEEQQEKTEKPEGKPDASG